MKKCILFIVVLLLLPISVLARQETKERLFKAIEDFDHIQVDDTIEILDTRVEDNTILLEMEEEEEKTTKEVSYSFEDVCLSFDSGYFLLEKNLDGTIQVGKIQNNQYAFYLYSILESLSTSSYEEENYYNEMLIEKIVNGFSIEEKNSFFEDSTYSKQFYNTGKTFGLQLVGERINNQQVKVTIHYQYYLDGDDTILVNPIVEEGKNELLKNPETGSYSFFITSLLILVIGLGAYTYCNPKEVE